MLTLDQITPIKDQILVRPDPVNEVSAGGIYIPETVRADNPNYYTMTGVVIRTGQGNYNADGARVPVSVQAGDRIVFGRYAGKQIEVLNPVPNPMLAGNQPQTLHLLMLREAEIIGRADSYVEPGYQAAQSGGVQRLPGDKFATT